MKQLKMIFAVSLMLVTIQSCQKDELTPVFDEIQLSQQETLSEETLAVVDLLVDEAVDANFNLLKSATLESAAYLTDCPVVTANKTATPQVVIIDFGTSCTGKDGKVRSGKIIVTSASFSSFPSVRDHSFNNYVVEGNKVEGSLTKTITKDQEKNIRTAVIQENITITLPDGGKSTRVATQTRQYQRNTLANSTDNQVVSWGTAEFTRVSGVKVTKTVNSADPLVFKVDCHHVVRGTVLFSNSKDRSWTINYGDGTCDDKAILTIGDKTKEIKIR